MSQKIVLSIIFAAAFVCGFAAFALYNQFGQEGQTVALFSQQEQSFEQRRTNLLNELSESINSAMLEGKYKCCIEPACTMCYLGNWIWQDGTCDCDGMIAKGEFDKVCPQCKRGIEEGRCISSLKESCEAGAVFE